MLTYRGDKFVKGKKFTINEAVYRFSKRDDEKLIFESISDSSKLVMTEDEFNEAERILTEKINQENKEINEIIGKVLRSKGLARKYEDVLKSKGITINYDSPQGVTLTGPNGKELYATSRIVVGPSKPGQNGTHKQGSNYYSKYAKEYKDELDSLKAMKRDDIIRKYSDVDSKEAMKRHKEKIANAQSEYEYYKNRVERDNAEYKEDRREGHLRNPSSKSSYSAKETQFDKSQADSTVDYLNYLSKPDTGKDFRNGKSYDQLGKDEDGYDNHYRTKNPVSNDKSENINTYNSLKRDVKDAQQDVNRYTYTKDGDYYSRTYGAMTDKQLEQRIANMKKELQKQIADLEKEHENEVKDLRKQNVSNKKEKEEKVKELKAKEKELNNFLKSKGIRESILELVNGKMLKEQDDFVDDDDEFKQEPDAEYIDKELSKVYDTILTLAQESYHMGFHKTSDTLNDVLGLLDYIKVE